MGMLDNLRAHGFDRSEHIPFTKMYRPRCSCCQVLVINGTATHETGCRNAVHECRGCYNLIPMNHRYCEGCV